MAHRTLLKRIAKWLACTLLLTQLAISAHGCPKLAALATAAQTVMAVEHAAPASAMPACHEPVGTTDSGAPNLCVEHCKVGQQSDRAKVSAEVSPALLNALYETPALPDPSRHPAQAGSTLSALVAASPPHAIAHCVLRI